MIIIAHRGLLEGPDSKLENHPDQIVKAVNSGFRVEIDLRYVDGAWWLGHDKPQYNIRWDFIDEYCNQLWIHAKDIITLHHLIEIDKKIKHATPPQHKFLNYFFHDQDDCTLTSERWIWVYPGKAPLTKNCVAVMPERVENWEGLEKCFGICTDYTFEYREKYAR